MNDTKQTLVSEFERLRDLIRAMGPIRNGAGTADPDPRIAAAEEMAKALDNVCRLLSVWDLNNEEDAAVSFARSALAAWNALK